MELEFVSNDGTILQTDEEKLVHIRRTIKDKKLSYYVKLSNKKVKFDVVTDYLPDIDKKKAGIYFLCNKIGSLVNIGATNTLYTRVYRKWNGKSGSSIADEFFYRYYHKAKILYIESEVDRKLCEIYFINKEKPPLNYQYAYYDTWIYKFMTTEFAKSKESTWSWRKDKVESDEITREIFIDINKRLSGGD